MQDVIYIAVIVGFCLLSILYLIGCGSMKKAEEK